jgi:hypothetical protein
LHNIKTLFTFVGELIKDIVFMNKLLESMIPQDIYHHFEFVSLSEYPDRFEMKLEEDAALVPAGLSDISDVVLDGFCNPLELLHFSIKGKPLYLKLYRRRWKSSCRDIHYSNRYNFHPSGAKSTHEFALFLKGEVGLTEDQYISFLFNTES